MNAISIYDFEMKLSNGEMKSLEDYRNQVLLIVNTASKCGFTKQLNGLQSLYDTYKDRGFQVLAFPCNQFNNQDPGSNEEIQSFCQLNYNVTFPIFSKIDVKGKTAAPLYQYLINQAGGFLTKQIKWNFTKFLIGKDGRIIRRFAPMDRPENIVRYIETALTE